MKQVVSLSGGKDSTAMLLMMIERNEQIDDVIYFDTGWEFPEMYEHIDLLEQNTGIEITRLKYKNTFDYCLSEHVLSRGKHKGQKGYGWPKPMARWCTTFKTQTIDKYLKKYGNDFIQCIGIAFDETKRIREGKRYPLVEYGITEKEALDYCYSKGYTWGGLYNHFSRVSCFCCPLKRINELRNLYNYYPILWETMKQMDDKAFNDFRIDYSLSELEERFENEKR